MGLPRDSCYTSRMTSLRVVGCVVLVFACGRSAPVLPVSDAGILVKDAAEPPFDASPSDAAILSTESVPICAPQQSVVATNVGQFVGGGGSLAYWHAGGVWVLPANSQTSIELSAGPPFSFGVDDAFLLVATNANGATTLTTIEIATLQQRTLAKAYWIYGGLCAHYAFWWETPSSINWTLRTAPADGSAPPVTVTTDPSGGGLFCDGAQMSWVDSSNTLWTMPASGGAPTSHGTVPGVRWTLTNDTLYGPVMGTTDANHFTPFSIVSKPLDSATITTLATSLPPNYPAVSGSPGNGPSAVVRASKRVFWSEMWGEGGAGPNGSIVNWQLRAVLPTGGTVDTIDSFTWTAQSATTGTSPVVASDGVAVYWTSEGNLMRLCD
jgi:hypothetical protein